VFNLVHEVVEVVVLNLFQSLFSSGIVEIPALTHVEKGDMGSLLLPQI
jgi:hypothetical protein